MKTIKVKCLQCGRRVDIGSFSGTYVLHNNKSGEICPNSSRQIPAKFRPDQELGSAKKTSQRKKEKTEKSASLIAQFEINQNETIRRSEALERDVRSAQRAETGSERSVFNVGGGLPTLGKSS